MSERPGIFATATEMLAALRARTISAVELLALHRARIETHNPPASLRATLDVNGQPVLGELGLVYPSVTTLAGQPSTAFPVGLTKSGVPIGLQAIGPYLEDRTPLRFAALVAREFGGFQPPPAFAAR